MLLFLIFISLTSFAEKKLEVIKKIPHSGYSEGLDFYSGFLWNAFPKVIKKIDPKDGQVVESFLPASEYSESILFFNNKIWNVSFSDDGVYTADIKSKKFKRVGSTPEVHGWGLAHNGKEILLTGNFSDKIYFLDPQTIKVKKTLSVTYKGIPVKDLEDLAFDGKYIWSSSFSAHRGQVFNIDPMSGKVGQFFSLPNAEECPVIDGLASEGNSLWITGKECPSLYQVKIPSFE